MHEKPNPEEETVMYIVVRSDLGMSKGKIAAQAGHAIHLAIRATDRSIANPLVPGHVDFDERWMRAWEGGSYTKLALRAESQEQLEALATRLEKEGAICARVIDEGRTEIPAGTMTALAMQPMPKNIAQHYVGGLKLL